MVELLRLSPASVQHQQTPRSPGDKRWKQVAKLWGVCAVAFASGLFEILMKE